MKPTRFFTCLWVGTALMPFYAGLSASAKPKLSVPKPAPSKPVSVPASGLHMTISIPNPQPIPALWKSVDIGAVGVPGRAVNPSISSSTAILDLEISASGKDIFGKADSFRFTYRPMTAHGQIVAQVVGFARKELWKVGVMIRDSDAPGAKFADLVLTPDKGAEFQWRAGTDGETQTSDQTPAPTPYWVKLTRTGDVFVGWISPDGKTWTERERAAIAMGPNVLVGLCVTSRKNDTLTQTSIQNVTVTPAARP